MRTREERKKERRTQYKYKIIDAFIRKIWNEKRRTEKKWQKNEMRNIRANQIVKPNESQMKSATKRWDDEGILMKTERNPHENLWKNFFFFCIGNEQNDIPFPPLKNLFSFVRFDCEEKTHPKRTENKIKHVRVPIITFFTLKMRNNERNKNQLSDHFDSNETRKKKLKICFRVSNRKRQLKECWISCRLIWADSKTVREKRENWVMYEDMFLSFSSFLVFHVARFPLKLCSFVYIIYERMYTSPMTASSFFLSSIDSTDTADDTILYEPEHVLS